MSADRLLAHYHRIADAPDAVAQLRSFVLDLAVRGKLMAQDAGDEPVAALLKRISAEKGRLVRAGRARAPKAATALAAEDMPFSLPGSWRWSQLAEVGLLGPRNDVADDATASFVPMTLIAAEFSVAHGHETRPWGEVKKGYTHFRDGDVGLAKITPCFENGKSTVFQNLTGGVGSGTTELHIVRPLLVDPTYILIFLKCPHFIETGIPRMTGTAGQKRVPTEYFAFSPFPLPPLAEQHRIVAKVGELMALCDRLEAARGAREAARDRLAAASLARLNAPDPAAFVPHARFAINTLPALTTRPDQIKALRQTILNLAVRGTLVAQDSGDEPAHRWLKRINAEITAYAAENRLTTRGVREIAEPLYPFDVPAGWSWSRLHQLFLTVTDGDHLPPPRADEGVAFLTIGNISTGSIDFTNCRLVPIEYFQALQAYRTPRRGDILYTVVGATYGRPVLVETDRPFCVQRHIAILKPPPSANRRFLALMLGSPYIYEQATRGITGTAQPTVALGPLRQFLVPVPPMCEQHRIVAKVDALMALCDRLEASLTTGNDTRRHLLDALLAEALAPGADVASAEIAHVAADA